MKHHFFWGGPFSNWHPCRFTYGVTEYNCVEQFMMAYKAKVFGDKNSLIKIMESDEPRTQKKLGRKVSGFNPDIWSDVCYPIVFAGCLAKFMQNEGLKQILLNTGDDILVEASPYDKIWGIGLSESNAKNIPPEQWPGENRLGKILMDVRRSV